MKLAEVKPLIDKLVDEQGPYLSPFDEEQARLAIEAAFVAGVRSGLKYTSNAKFAEVFGGKRSEK